MKLYKVLGPHGESCHGGSYTWSLPSSCECPGDWTLEIDGDLEPCKKGYHLCQARDLLDWIGSRIFLAEYDDDGMIVRPDKTVVRKARLVSEMCWNEKIARLFACDCVERILPIANDNRCNEAVRVSREFAMGNATKKELSSARDAVGNIACYSAWDGVGNTACYSPWDVTRCDAFVAAEDAAKDAAKEVSMAAVKEVFMKSDKMIYANSATANAARNAALSAEKAWQQRRLMEYLEGNLT